jgi:hypothetical protein
VLKKTHPLKNKACTHQLWSAVKINFLFNELEVFLWGMHAVRFCPVSERVFKNRSLMGRNLTTLKSLIAVFESDSHCGE